MLLAHLLVTKFRQDTGVGTMQVNFNSIDEYRDFLYSDFGNMTGSTESYGDRFTKATKAVDLLCADLSLDDSLLDLEELG